MKRILAVAAALAASCIAYLWFFKPPPAVEAMRASTVLTITEDDRQGKVLHKRIMDRATIRSIASAMNTRVSEPCECAYMNDLEFQSPEGIVKVEFSEHCMDIAFKGTYRHCEMPQQLYRRVIAAIGDSPGGWYIRKAYERRQNADLNAE